MTEKNHDEMMKMVSAATRNLAVELVLARGVPLQIVLAAMHAHTVGAIAEAYGGPMAALASRQAAERVEHLPSREAYERAFPLATATPAGRA